MRRKLLILAVAIAILLLLAGAAGVAAFYSPLVTHYVDSESFRRAMEDETAKGLHFPRSRYSAIRRTSAFTAHSESFEARNGEKAMKSLDGRGITATFDPLGVFVRQWRFTDVRVQSGDVEIQIYKANPEAVAPKPWFSIFLPNRVYLEKIESEQADITWQFRGERAGFFGTHLFITPHGPDFEYVATSGRLKMALLPDLDLHRAHLLITKTLLTIYDIDLASDVGSGESIRAQANAGMGKDRSVDLRANFNQVPIRSWLPVGWKEHLNGSASGDLHWAGKDPKLESSSGEGSIRVTNGRIENLPVLEKRAELAQKKSFEHLELNDCSLSFGWKYPRIDLSNITIEEKGNSGSREKCRSSSVVCAARSDLGLPVNISIGCRTRKKFLAAERTAISGPKCIFSERSMTPGRISARASLNFSNIRPAPISVSSFVSLKVG